MRSSAGRPASSLDDVALGRGDRHLRPDRRRALRDARQHVDVVEAHADGAAVARPRRRGTARPCSCGVRALASPPITGTPGRARREVLQQRVGREGERVGQQDRAARAGQVLHPHDGDHVVLHGGRRVERAARCRRRATPPTRRPPCRSSCSAPQPSTPPAPQPTSAAGRSASWTPSSVASGSLRCGRRRRTRRRGRRARRRAPRRPPARPRSRRRAGRSCVEMPVPMRTPIASHDTPVRRAARRASARRAILRRVPAAA